MGLATQCPFWHSFFGVAAGVEMVMARLPAWAPCWPWSNSPVAPSKVQPTGSSGCEVAYCGTGAGSKTEDSKLALGSRFGPSTTFGALAACAGASTAPAIPARTATATQTRARAVVIIAGLPVGPGGPVVCLEFDGGERKSCDRARSG